MKTSYVFIWGGLCVLLCLLSCQNPVLKDQIDLDLLQSHVNTVVKTRCAENSFSLHRDLVLSYASRLNGINHTIKDFSPLTKGIDTLAYICNYDEGGWALFSEDKRIAPILAYCPTGSLCWNDSIPDGLRAVLTLTLDDVDGIKRGIRSGYFPDDRTNYWEHLEKHKSFLTKPQTRSTEFGFFEAQDEGVDSVWRYTLINAFDSIVVHSDIPHLVSTKWGQEAPWNNPYPMMYPWLTNSPRVYAGCVPVSMGQILYYCHHHIGKPNGLYHNISFTGSFYYQTLSPIPSDFNPNSTRWDYMALDSVDTATNLGYVSDLLAEIADTVHLKYYENGSYSVPTIRAFSNYGLNCSHSSYVYSTVKSSILNGMPVLAGAYSESNKTGGHAFIIDGWRQTRRYTCIYYYWEKVPYNDSLFDEYYNDPYNDYYLEEMARDIYGDFEPGVVYEEILPPYLIEYLKMNWGYDGDSDDVLVYSEPSSWHCGPVTYQYYPEIFYGFN